MLTAEKATLQTRANTICDSLPHGVGAEVIESSAKVGGGALPLLELAGPVCAIDPRPFSVDELAHRLRAGQPPVIARAHDGRLLIDPRTLTNDEAREVAAAVAAAFA
jgi:L-seryl-tRNA(Ser) seleniumtransferase